MTRCEKVCNIIKNALRSQEREINSTWSYMKKIVWETWHSSRQIQELGNLFQVHGIVYKQRYEYRV